MAPSVRQADLPPLWASGPPTLRVSWRSQSPKARRRGHLLRCVKGPSSSVRLGITIRWAAGGATPGPTDPTLLGQSSLQDRLYPSALSGTARSGSWMPVPRGDNLIACMPVYIYIYTGTQATYVISRCGTLTYSYWMASLPIAGTRLGQSNPPYRGHQNGIDRVSLSVGGTGGAPPRETADIGSSTVPGPPVHHPAGWTPPVLTGPLRSPQGDPALRGILCRTSPGWMTELPPGTRSCRLGHVIRSAHRFAAAMSFPPRYGRHTTGSPDDRGHRQRPSAVNVWMKGDDITCHLPSSKLG